MAARDAILADNLTWVIDWLKFADTKAAAISRLTVVYLGFSKFAVDGYMYLLNDVSSGRTSSLKLGTASLAIGGLFYCIGRILVFILLAIRATLKNDRPNPLFFAHIARYSQSNYINLMRTRKIKDLNNDLISQTHTNAVIAAKKFSYVNEAVTSFALTTLMMPIAYLSTLKIYVH